MKVLRRFERASLMLLLGMAGLLLYTLHSYDYDEVALRIKDAHHPLGNSGVQHINHNMDDVVEDPVPPTRPMSTVDKSKKIIIYPRSFALNTSADLLQHYTQTLGQKLPDQYEILKYHYKYVPEPSEEDLDEMLPHDHEQGSTYDDPPTSWDHIRSTPLNEKILQSTFSPFSYDSFGIDAEIDEDLQKCPALHEKRTIKITKPTSFTTSRRDIVERFFASKSDYSKEFEYFFEENPIADQLKKNTIDDYWFRLAGSSVYLEQYGVHFMVSRVVYSTFKRRDKPVLSLMYGQIFDENWEELHNVELIVPTNNPDVHSTSPKDEDQLYTVRSYPDFLPIPAYHKFKVKQEGYYGPEDPRIMLIKNPRGFEEPLVIFNANHRKIIEEEMEDSSKSILSFNEFRSMFISWPWQFQRGKLNMEDLKSQHNTKLYNRVIELKIHNSLRSVAQQKNWTPFLSFQERLAYDHDKYLYMVIRWSNLEVLKCSLTQNLDNSVSVCTFDYKLRTTKEQKGVGPLRGGTEMINVNMLLHENSQKFPQLRKMLDSMPAGREVYVGVARAHFKECGCGKGFYRPNLVTLVKEFGRKEDFAKNMDEHTEDYKSQYKLSEVGSFMSLDVPVQSWDISKPSQDCIEGSPNSLIPNGISAWDVHKVGSAVEDYLTLSYSVSDYTVDILHVQGLLGYIMKGLSDPSHLGFDNNNVLCAMQKSSDYCAAYGKEHTPAPEEEP